MRDHEAVHHVHLIPGLFGFGKLAGYDYFEHVERALAQRFERAGIPLRTFVVSTPPTASIAVRAQFLAQHLDDTEEAHGPIHLIGHSTGGLDARLLTAPGTALDLPPRVRTWPGRIRSVVTMNTPHYGTPLAGYFTTTAGTRMLYLLSLLSVASLGLGRLPLAVVSGMLGAIGGLDRRLGLQLKFLEELTAQFLRIIGPEGRDQIHAYLSHVKYDQGGIIQLMPEVMELFNATVVNDPAVRYGSVVTCAPAPGPRRVLRSVASPISAFHLAAYTTVYSFAGRAMARYPYAAADDEQSALLAAAFPSPLGPTAVDGIVPTLSMLWGKLLWCGAADHLDVVGHFRDASSRPRIHVDWLRSGAQFGLDDFAAMMTAITDFLLDD